MVAFGCVELIRRIYDICIVFIIYRQVLKYHKSVGIGDSLLICAVRAADSKAQSLNREVFSPFLEDIEGLLGDVIKLNIGNYVVSVLAEDDFLRILSLIAKRDTFRYRIYYLGGAVSGIYREIIYLCVSGAVGRHFIVRAVRTVHIKGYTAYIAVIGGFDNTENRCIKEVEELEEHTVLAVRTRERSLCLRIDRLVLKVRSLGHGIFERCHTVRRKCGKPCETKLSVFIGSSCHRYRAVR